MGRLPTSVIPAPSVIPAQAGTQGTSIHVTRLDSDLRRNDDFSKAKMDTLSPRRSATHLTTGLSKNRLASIITTNGKANEGTP